MRILVLGCLVALVHAQTSDRGAYCTTLTCKGSTAAGRDATAFGSDNNAIGQDATAFGVGSEASGSWSIAAGYQAKATGDHAIAFGNNAAAGKNQFVIAPSIAFHTASVYLTAGGEKGDVAGMITSLKSRVSSLESRLTTEESRLATETSRRTSADSGLSGRLSTIEGGYYRQGKVLCQQWTNVPHHGPECNSGYGIPGGIVTACSVPPPTPYTGDRSFSGWAYRDSSKEQCLGYGSGNNQPSVYVVCAYCQKGVRVASDAVHNFNSTYAYNHTPGDEIPPANVTHVLPASTDADERIQAQDEQIKALMEQLKAQAEQIKALQHLVNGTSGE